MSTPVADSQPVAYRLPRWLQRAGIARSTWHTLPEDILPNMVTLNGLVYVVEEPKSWFARIAEIQRAEGKPRRPRRQPEQAAA